MAVQHTTAAPSSRAFVIGYFEDEHRGLLRHE